MHRSDLGDGYDMKTTVALPVALVRAVDRLARRMSKPRSAVISAAVAAYVSRREPETVTDALNRLALHLDTGLGPSSEAAARRAMSHVEW